MIMGHGRPCRSMSSGRKPTYRACKNPRVSAVGSPLGNREKARKKQRADAPARFSEPRIALTVRNSCETLVEKQPLSVLRHSIETSRLIEGLGSKGRSIPE